MNILTLIIVIILLIYIYRNYYKEGYVVSNLLKQNEIPIEDEVESNIPIDVTNFMDITASSEYDSQYIPHNAFTGNGLGWATKGKYSDYWIQVELVNPVILYKIILTGRANGEQLSTWELQGSEDGITFIPLLHSTTPLSTKPISFDIPIYTTPYKYYRIYAYTSTVKAVNPGLTYIELFPYFYSE
jgi:hypothetical protein